MDGDPFSLAAGGDLGRGRDYEDVPPLKGVHAGPSSTTSGVEVEIRQLR